MPKVEHNALVLIPARFGSTRFSGKPLAKIAGKSMISRVYNNVSASGFPVWVVTDDERIENHVKDFGGKVIRVDDDVASGTERIFLAYQKGLKEGHFSEMDLVINVQGDEPLLSGKSIRDLVEFHMKTNFDITTLLKEESYIENKKEIFLDSNKVKVIFGKEDKKCHYFSRSPIPFVRNPKALQSYFWFLHIGVYSYRPQALERFCRATVTYYEDLEKLEQLRALELGLRIGGHITTENLIGVDTPDDLAKVEEVLDGKIS